MDIDSTESTDPETVAAETEAAALTADVERLRDSLYEEMTDILTEVTLAFAAANGRDMSEIAGKARKAVDTIVRAGWCNAGIDFRPTGPVVTDDIIPLFYGRLFLDQLIRSGEIPDSLWEPALAKLEPDIIAWWPKVMAGETEPPRFAFDYEDKQVLLPDFMRQARDAYRAHEALTDDEADALGAQPH